MSHPSDPSPGVDWPGHPRRIVRALAGMLLLAAGVMAQEQAIFKVPAASVGFGGKVQIQKEGERTFRKVSQQKNLIDDGDIIKTGFKSYLIVRIDKNSKLIIGSNSKVMVEFIPFEGGGGGNGPAYGTKMTVFEGGAYFSWVGESELNIFTDNALAGGANGDFVTIYIPKDGRTLDVVFKDKLMAQNLAKKENISLGLGEYVWIQGDKNPSEPRTLTNEIALEMVDIFGETFVTKEMEKAGIKLNFDVKKTRLEAASNYQEPEPETKVVGFFQMDQILAKIRQIENVQAISYQPPFWVDDMTQYQYYFESKLAVASVKAGNSPGTYTGLHLRGGMKFNQLTAGMNLPLETSAEGGMRVNTFSSLKGIFDKIWFLDYDNPQLGLNVHLGEIRNLNYGRGNLVRDFSNELLSTTEQPLGLQARYSYSMFLDADFFIADLSDFSVMGANTTYDNGWSLISGTIIADLQQEAGIYFGDNAYKSGFLPALDRNSTTGSIWGWEPFFEVNFIQDVETNIFAYAGASFLMNGGDVEGYSFQLPGAYGIWRRMSGFLEGVVTTGRNHPGYFNQFYLEDRVRVNRITTPTADVEGYSQSDRHPPMGVSKGFRTGGEWQILDQLWLGFAYGQNWGKYVPKKAAPADSADSVFALTDTLLPPDARLEGVNVNRNIKFRLFIGNGLLEGLKRFEVTYDMQQGSFGRQIRHPADTAFKYPDLTPVREQSKLLSLNSMFGFLLEYQVMENASAVVQFRGFPLDFNGDGIYNSGELITEFSATWRMIF